MQTCMNANLACVDISPFLQRVLLLQFALEMIHLF